MKTVFPFVITSILCLSAAPIASTPMLHTSLKSAIPHKVHATYLMQSKDIKRAIDTYTEIKNQKGHHDFELLEQMALILLEQGSKSLELEDQLISLYGAGIAGVSTSLDILEQGILSPHPESQIAAIQYLGRMQDDRCDTLLIKAMSSPFLGCRLEAAYHLSHKKHPVATGQLESLMHRCPVELKPLFPQFFSFIGTPEAVSILKHLMEDPSPYVRIQSINSAVEQGRDDLLSSIRSHLHHQHPAEQEACISALGMFRDSKSLNKLQQLAKKKNPYIKISALKALHRLGQTTAKDELMEMAKQKDIFAINALAEISSTEDTLYQLTKDSDQQVRVNAALSLLFRRDPRCIPALGEILVKDPRDLAFMPKISPGGTLLSWRISGSSTQKTKISKIDHYHISLVFREQVLKHCLELPEKDFLLVAEGILSTNQIELVPILIRLLLNHPSPEVKEFLFKWSQKAGAPLIRTYCYLALYRLDPNNLESKEYLLKWIDQAKEKEMIQFRPLPTIESQNVYTLYELTPEEHSQLLIDAYSAFVTTHSPEGIDLILEGIKSGNPKNRYALAGMLLKCMQ